MYSPSVATRAPEAGGQVTACGLGIFSVKIMMSARRYSAHDWDPGWPLRHAGSPRQKPVPAPSASNSNLNIEPAAAAVRCDLNAAAVHRALWKESSWLSGSDED